MDRPMIVYLATNMNTGRKYVGITVGRLSRRWREHLRLARDGSQTAFHASIRKHGAEAFIVTEIACALDRANLGALESCLIVQHQTKAPNGYNLTDGGDGVTGLPPYIVARTADKNRGRRHTPEARCAIGESSRGHAVTPEMRAAIGASHKGKNLSDEHRKKLSLAKLGRPMPPRSSDHRARISAGLKMAHARRRAAQ